MVVRTKPLPLFKLLRAIIFLIELAIYVAIIMALMIRCVALYL